MQTMGIAASVRARDCWKRVYVGRARIATIVDVEQGQVHGFMGDRVKGLAYRGHLQNLPSALRQHSADQSSVALVGLDQERLFARPRFA